VFADRARDVKASASRRMAASGLLAVPENPFHPASALRMASAHCA